MINLNKLGSASEICKYELFKDWFDILMSIKEYNTNKSVKIMSIEKFYDKSINEFLYQEVKMNALDYQNAKLKVCIIFYNNLKFWFYFIFLFLTLKLNLSYMKHLNQII